MYGEVGVINMNNQMMNNQINQGPISGQTNQNPINRNCLDCFIETN